MNRQKILIILLLMFSSFLMSCDADATASEDEIKLIPIEIELMKKDVVEHTYIAIGEVVPKNQIDLAIGSGSIEGIFVMPGDLVEKNAVLVELDDNTVTSSYTSTESQLRTIRDNLSSQYKSAYDNYISQKTLFDSGVISKVVLDQAKTQSDNLYRQYNDAKVTYNNQLGTLKETVSDRLLASPISGKVAAVYIKEGQVVNNQLAITIIDDSQLYVKTFVSGDLKRVLNINDTVTLKLDGDNNNRAYGSIHQINELPNQTTKLFEMLIEINEEFEIEIGEFTEIEFVLERYEANMVPTKSIVRSGMDQYIYIFEKNAVRKQLVTTGLSKGEWIEVKEFDDLFEVIVKGQNQLTTKSKVLVVDNQ